MSREIEELRKKIADADRGILELLSRRIQIAKRIGELKREEGLEVVDPKVEAAVLWRAEASSKRLGLDTKFTKQLMSFIIGEAVRVQVGPYKDRARYLYSIFERALALETRGVKVVRLDVGEPDLASPEPAKDALRDAIYNNRYIGYTSSGGLKELREAIAEVLNGRYGTDLGPEQVLIAPGGKFAIFAAILSFISQGDRALVPAPTWPIYGNTVRLAGGREDTLKTRFEDHWNIDLEKLSQMLQVNPKLLILCTPNNPTGKVFGEKTLREIIDGVEQAGSYVLADEVYESYATSFKSLLQVATSNFIYINTFSKRYGMTGWRIGFAVSDEETIGRMQSVLQLSITCVPEFIQKAALAALRMTQDYYEDYAEEMRERIDLTCRELDSMPIECLRPDGGMYLFPRAKVEGFDSETFALRLLETERVAVTPGQAFGDYPEHFRISLGTNRANIQNGIKGVGRVLAGWRKG